jgi:hypothetical protein
VFFAVPLLIRGTSIYLHRAHLTLEGSRYMLVPALLLICALLVAAFRPGTGRAVRGVATVVLGTVLVLSFRTGSIRTQGPEWRPGLAAAKQRCVDHGGDSVGSGRSARNPWGTRVQAGQVLIPTAPGLPTLSTWNVVIDCSRLS